MSLPRIAVDAMGGDHGVRVMVSGAALARQLRAGVFPGDLTLGAGGYGGTGTIASSSLSGQP